MPRVIVTTQPFRLPDDAQVLFDEDVRSVHVNTPHGATQLAERLAWAIGDAEYAENARRDPRVSKSARRSTSESSEVPLSV
jgi:hypothetical protein